MEIRDMKHSDIETRLAEIDEELKVEEISEEQIEELEKEVDELKEREEEIKEEVKVEEETRKAVLKSANVVEERKEKTKMNIEVRNTPEYLDAWVENLKGKASEEQRTLLTVNAENGTIAVPDYVSDKIWTSWEKSELLSRIRKVYLKGNYEVGYEVSATPAVVHPEGDPEVEEEQLVIAYVKFTAEYIKKWISISRTVMALRGQAFIDYLYDEIGHQLALEAEKQIVTELMTSDLTAKVEHEIDADAVLAGIVALSAEAVNPVCIMSKTTYATLRSLRSQLGIRLDDVFEGLDVIFNNNVTEGVLVADLDSVEANFPNGENFEYHFDEITLMTENKVRILGEIMFAVKLIRMNGAAYVKAGS